jgi:SAM-dependent methyltransferase
VVVGDAASLPFDDASFDVVLSSFVVFFLPEPTAALREWRRVLAPGGRLVMSTWNGADPRWSWERDVRKAFASDDVLKGFALVNRFDEEAKVEGELRSAGFEPGQVTRHVIEFVYADEDAWWDWNWSHGSRVFLEELSDDAQERFRALAYEAMQPLHTDQGFPRTYTALFAKATHGV